MGAARRAAGFFEVHVLARVKALDLGGDAAGIGRSIELGDRADTGAAGQQPLPEIGHVEAQAGDRPQAGDDHPAPGAPLATERLRFRHEGLLLQDLGQEILNLAIHGRPGQNVGHFSLRRG